MAREAGESSGANILDVVTVDLSKFRKELKKIGPEWPKELAQAHRDLAKIGERVSQSEARRMGGVQRKAAAAIRGRGNQRDARISIRPSKSKRAGTAMANVAFWGAEKRTGWYARPRYSDSLAPQHPPWIGNNWQVANPTEGPYAINAALARNWDDLQAAYTAMIDRLVTRAFPD
jgi:hypothetical protein